jgi:hypothetical protein
MVQCNIFYHGILNQIKLDDQEIVYPLLLELIELEAESNKKYIDTSLLYKNYVATETYDSDSESETKEETKESLEETKESLFESKRIKSNEKSKTKSKRDKSKVINEFDLNHDFLYQLKERIRNVHIEELIRKNEENQGDLLIIEL